uniref:Uncharacterized protein n=1 Tax=Molossus molossus TaxID=27622 RepID=A0A7J8JXQ5_MOLMO|nr:hypothetical protein HJG59_008094 [Molossus molossus]
MLALGPGSTVLTNLLRGLGLALEETRGRDRPRDSQRLFQLLRQRNTKVQLERGVLSSPMTREDPPQVLPQTEAEAEGYGVVCREAESQSKSTTLWPKDCLGHWSNSSPLDPRAFLLPANYTFFKDGPLSYVHVLEGVHRERQGPSVHVLQGGGQCSTKQDYGHMEEQPEDRRHPAQLCRRSKGHQSVCVAQSKLIPLQ